MSKISEAQMLALSPDPQSLAAGRKLGRPAHWRGLGESNQALWGECRGSALYQVVVALDDFAYHCSCPSRKFPCKHVIGLLTLSSVEPPRPADAPDWVDAWLAKRTERAEKQQEAARKPAGQTSADASRVKRVDDRMKRVLAGVEALELWLADIERDGLARLQAQPGSFWERQAARLVDAQAPGLAGRIRHMSSILGSSPDWPDRLLGELGLLALLLHAFRRIDQLDPALQHDVRRLIGWNLSTEEVTELGPLVRDRWTVIGQGVEAEDKLTVQRTWLAGAQTGERAVILQFAAFASAGFPFVATPGTQQELALRFWPGAERQRARIEQRFFQAAPLHGSLPGSQTISGFLGDTAARLARQPWQDRFGCMLRDVVPVKDGTGAWWARDLEGAALPLSPGDRWGLLAITGGTPSDLYGEWDGRHLWPLGLFHGDAFYTLGAAA